MSLATQTIDGAELRSEKNVEVISTASGGADVARAIHRSGVFLGYRSAEKRPPENLPVNFIDWPFDCERADFV